MDQELEVYLILRDSLTNSSPPSRKIVKLVENGRIINKENVNQTDENHQTILFRVLQNQKTCSPAIVSFLLEKGALVSINKDTVGIPEQIALHVTIQNVTDYSLDIVKILATDSPTVNTEGLLWTAPLEKAVVIKHKSAPEIVRLLLEKGADINRANPRNERTPLDYAVGNEHESALEIVQLLLEKGAHITNKDVWDEKTPVHHAAKNLHQYSLEIICLLIEEGAAINQTNWKGKTPSLCSSKQK